MNSIMESKINEIYMGDRIKNVYNILEKKQEIMYNLLKKSNTDTLDTILLPSKYNDGAYILKDNMILHGEIIEDFIYYYNTIDNSYYGGEYKNEILTSDIRNIDTNSGRKVFCRNLLTGQDLYTIEENGKTIFEHSKIEIPIENLSFESLLSDGKNFFILKEYVREGFEHSYGRRNRPCYRTVYYQIKNGNKIKIGSDFEEVLKLVFPKNRIGKYEKQYSNEYDFLVNSIKLGKDELVEGKHYDYSVYFKNDIFYIIIDKGTFSHFIIEIPAIEYEGINYCLIANNIAYYTGKEKGLITLNSVYTTHICEKHIMFNNEGSLEFKDTPYHKYGTVQDNKIIKNERIYNLDFSKTLVENYTIIKSEYPIINIPRGEVYLVNNYFVCLDLGKIFIFYKTEKSYASNILKPYKNFRFQRKKSNFYLNRESGDIYIYADNCKPYIVTKKEFSIKSLELISKKAAIIKGHDNNLYCVNEKGYKRIISPLEEYKCFTANSNITGLKKDGTIEINDLILIFDKNKKEIRLDKKIIWDNVKYKGSMEFITSEPIENCNSYVTADLKENYTPITFNGKSLYQNNYFDCYENSVGIFAYLKKECCKIRINNEELRSIVNDSEFVCTKRGYFIKGYHINDGLISQVQRYNSEIYNNLVDKIAKERIISKNKLINFIDNKILYDIVKEVNKYNINITKEEIINSSNLKDTLLVLLNIRNIKENFPIDFDKLSSDIENILKNKDYNFTKTNIFNDKNVFNSKKFMENGLSIDKFNDYSEEITFKSTTAKNRLLKGSLCNTLFTQLYNMIGSKKRHMDGIFQLVNLENLISIENDVNISISEYIHSLEESDKKTIIKFLNSCGYKIYKFLKKYNIEMNYDDFYIIINKQLPARVHIKKLEHIANDMVLVTNKIIKNIDDSPIDKIFKNFISKYVEWSMKHIQDDFSVIEDTCNIVRDFKENTFTIKLWDRKNLITNLVQGNKTHCCIAADAYNIKALIDYIYNKNMVLVEIRSKEDVIGQAFVYLAVSEDKLRYRYENKYHLFMIIDNVEINSNYIQYTEDIAKNLQTFMIGFKDYVSSNISDILLGVNYNDITPPYDFKANINVSILGCDHYIDSRSTFYKFI